MEEEAADALEVAEKAHQAREAPQKAACLSH
jgi:hypothetical protein